MKKFFSIIISLTLLLGWLPPLPAAYAADSDSTLANLTVQSVVYDTYGSANVTSCGIYPAFSSTRTEGEVDVANEVAEVDITAQPTSGGATLQINGVPAAAGVASAVYGRSLAVGDNLIPITVTAADGSQRTYTLHIKRVSADFALAPLPQTPRAYQASDYAKYRRLLAIGSEGHCLALKKDGVVVAWGNNGKGQCTVPAGLCDVSAVAAGQAHSLVLKEDGTVAAWGWDKYGQCDVPAGLDNVAAIAGGGAYSAALKADGTVVVWGDNSDGQCNVPAGLSNVVDIQCAGSYMLVLKADGRVVAWGWNYHGQCDVPDGLDHVVAIAADNLNSMALKDDGTLVMWGKGAYGGTLQKINLQYIKSITATYSYLAAIKWDGSVAVWPSGITDYKEISVPLPQSQPALTVVGCSGEDNLLVLNEDGTVDAWGDNVQSQCDVPRGLNLLADDQPPYSGPSPNIPQTPAAYAASSYVRAAAKVIGYDGRAYVLNMDGTVKVYVRGQDYHGLADVPSGLNNVKSIAATVEYIIALKADGTVAVWGDDRYGNCAVPAGLSNVTAVAAGTTVTAALKADGTVVVWGDNSAHQCDVPAGLSGVTAIAAGYKHCLALKQDGTVVAWGDDSYHQCDVPAGLNNVARVFVEWSSSFALKNDGSVVAWGDNSRGQCDVPADLTDAVDLSVNEYYICAALRKNGTVAVWGNNVYGSRNVPPGLHDVVAATAGNGVYAMKADGTVVHWAGGKQIDEQAVTGLTGALTVKNNIVILRDGNLKHMELTYSEPINAFLTGLNVLAGHYFDINSVELLNPSTGQPITSVTAQGGYRVQAGIASNNTAATGGLTILQVRGGAGAGGRAGGQVLGCIGLENDIPVAGQPVSADFTMPAGVSGPAYVDVFVWDGWDTMVPRATPNQTLTFNVTQ
jgi:alpha-tubulin suppressor-like RCC1 family protein